MIRHPSYLEIPWNLHWQGLHKHRHLWWLVAVLTLMAIFLIGVGVTGGTLSFG
ncbi:MAG TPA: hypothetical protein VF732_03780 [Nitrospira sp.]|jgi:hypothetical protein